MTREQFSKLKEGTLITLIVGKDTDGKDRIRIARVEHTLGNLDSYYWRGMSFTYEDIRRTIREDFQRLYKQEELRHNGVVSSILKLQQEYYKE